MPIFAYFRLSELIAWHSAFSGVNDGATTSSGVSSGDIIHGQPLLAGIPLLTNGLSTNSHNVDDEALDDLIEKLKNNVEIQDPRLSQVVGIYERKINSLLVSK